MERALPTRPARDLRRRRRQLGRFFPHTPLGARIEALPELGLVYVRNPKVASSTVLDWLDWMHTGVQREDGYHVRRESSLPRPSEVGWERVMRMIDGEAFRFSFVRDPISRFESAYRSKILQPRPPRRQVLEVLDLPDDPAVEVSFEDFVRAVEQQEPLHMDLHWRPQHLNLMHPVFTFDLLGRLERFEEDMAEICRRLDLPSPPTRSRNVSRISRPSEYEGRPDLVERVRTIYQRDCELYGY